MAAGTVARANPDPTPNTPIVVEHYTGELNTLVAAHNNLYNDWAAPVAKAVAVLGTATSPNTEKKVTANGVVIGDYANEITAGFVNLEDMEDERFLRVNNVSIAGCGTLIPAVVVRDTTGMIDGGPFALSHVSITTNVNAALYSTYIFTGNTGINLGITLPLTGTLPSASFIVPVGFVMTFVNDKASGGNININWTDPAGAHAVTLAHVRNFVTLMALPNGSYLTLNSELS